jgi:hypothetical protein
MEVLLEGTRNSLSCSHCWRPHLYFRQQFFHCLQLVYPSKPPCCPWLSSSNRINPDWHRISCVPPLDGTKSCVCKLTVRSKNM